MLRFILKYAFFILVFVISLTSKSFAQSRIEIDLNINHIPSDGIAFTQLSLGEIKNALGQTAISHYKASFQTQTKSFDAQIIPSPTFGKDNYNAMVLIAAPGSQKLTGKLKLEYSESKKDAAISNRYTVSTSAAQWEFSPQGKGIFPAQVTLPLSGKIESNYVWEDRLYDSSIGGFNLNNDPKSTLTTISDGTIATVLRGKARYSNQKHQLAPGNPSAVYDWYFFKNSPLIFVDAVQESSSPFQWGQSHFMEWNFKQKYFSAYLDSKDQEIHELTAAKKSITAPDWTALISANNAIAYLGDKTTIYDGVNDFGNYIRSANPSPAQSWNGEKRRLTAWLWVSDINSPENLSQQLNKLSAAAAARFVDSNVSIVNKNITITAAEMPASLSDSVQDKSWVNSLLQREISQGKISFSSGKTPIPSTWHFLKSGELGLALDIHRDSVQLVSLYDLQQQKELSADESVPLFELHFLDTVSKKEYAWDATRDWQNVVFQKDQGDFELIFTQQDSQNHPIVVTISASAISKDSAWDWNIDVNNKTSSWSISKVLFPQIRLRSLGSDTAAFTPQGPGLVSDHIFANKFNYNSIYPTGSFGTMQYMSVYQNNENPSGLYVARHDPSAAFKMLHLHTNNVEATTTLFFSEMPENPNTPGNGFKLEGSGVWKLLHGDWFDAARYYKSWVKDNASWWPEVNNDGRIDTPLWYKKLNVWSSKGGNPKTAVEAIKKMKDFIGLPMGDHWYYWHQIPFDNDYPHYFPAVDGFKEAINTLQKDGVHVMPYINGRLWDTHDKGAEDFEYTKKALPWTTKTLDGTSLAPYKSTFKSTESDGSKVQLAVMCPYTRFWQNEVTSIVAKLTNDVGVDGVYLDQIGTSQPIPCMDSSHGHPLGGGHWWVDGYNQMLKQIQEKIPAHAIITTEGNAEPYMKYMDGMLSWQWQKDGQVPAYSVVYGGAVQVFGRSYNTTKDTDPNSSIRTKAGQELIFGEQIGWISPDLFFNTRLDDKTRNYFKQLVHVRNRINPYIYAGEMLRQPRLTGNNPPVTSDWVWQGKNLVTVNSVLTAAWKKSGANKIAFVFTNVSENSLNLHYQLKPEDYGIPMNHYTIKQWDSTQPDKEKIIQTDKSTFALALPGLSSIVWEISWK